MHASGTFEVKTLPVDASPIGKDAGVGRMTIDKAWLGGIVGTSKGEMLMNREANGAMSYVALEKVTAAVDGKAGTFVFIHRATMMQTDPATAVLDCTVVPNSGTGALDGIDGSLKIVIDKTGHSYDFTYTLPVAK